MARTLLDQRNAGKQLVLITNSDYTYTNRMMSYACEVEGPGTWLAWMHVGGLA